MHLLCCWDSCVGFPRSRAWCLGSGPRKPRGRRSAHRDPGWQTLHIAQPGHLLPLAFFWVEADSASTPEKCQREWKGEVKKVDWEAFTHYSGPDSGHQAFTKGLLLVDNSCGSQRQALEITARDCQWRGRKGNEWIAVQNGDSLSVLDGQDYVSSFIVTRKDGPKGHWPDLTSDLTPPVWIPTQEDDTPNIRQYSLVWNLHDAFSFPTSRTSELQATTWCV